jgi:nitrogen regulatory protein PII
MQNSFECKGFELICVIVNFGLGSEILKYAKHHGIGGGTIFLGKGTIKNALLEFLEIAETRKEIVIMAGESDKVYTVLDELNKKFKFDKPHHGIAFTTSIIGVLGIHNIMCDTDNESRGENSKMHNMILVIVERGKAENVIEAATKAGSRGGTIINARGSGKHETSKLFSMEIEPEKEMVLIVCEANLTNAITASINEELKIDEPGNGVVFVQEINKTYGLY